jgi:hypothetical protein
MRENHQHRLRSWVPLAQPGDNLRCPGTCAQRPLARGGGGTPAAARHPVGGSALGLENRPGKHYVNCGRRWRVSLGGGRKQR